MMEVAGHELIPNHELRSFFSRKKSYPQTSQDHR